METGHAQLLLRIEVGASGLAKNCGVLIVCCAQLFEDNLGRTLPTVQTSAIDRTSSS